MNRCCSLNELSSRASKSLIVAARRPSSSRGLVTSSLDDKLSAVMRCVWLFIEAIGARLFRARKYPPSDASSSTSGTPQKSRAQFAKASSITLKGSATAANPRLGSADTGTITTRKPLTVTSQHFVHAFNRGLKRNREVPEKFLEDAIGCPLLLII